MNQCQGPEPPAQTSLRLAPVTPEHLQASYPEDHGACGSKGQTMFGCSSKNYVMSSKLIKSLEGE